MILLSLFFAGREAVDLGSISIGLSCEDDPSVCRSLSFCLNNDTCRCVDGAYSQSGLNNDCLNSSSE